MTAVVSETTSETAAEVGKPTPRRRRGALGWAGQVLSWFAMFAIGAAFVVSLVIPRAVGATTYVIETGSMRPSLPPGTMVAVRPSDPTSVEVGDVITYQLHSGDPTVVTHRVVTVGYDGEGTVRWRTQGDANSAIDQNWVTPAQLRGRLWYAVPMLGHVTALVSAQQRGLIVGGLAVGLGAYAVGQLAGAWRDRRRRLETAGTTG